MTTDPTNDDSTSSTAAMSHTIVDFAKNLISSGISNVNEIAKYLADLKRAGATDEEMLVYIQELIDAGIPEEWLAGIKKQYS